MIEELQQYLKLQEEAQTTWRKGQAAARAALSEARQAALRGARPAFTLSNDFSYPMVGMVPYNAAMNAAHAQYAADMITARAVFAHITDPLARFIIDTCLSEYPEQAARILEALPAELPALRQIAREADWCGTFDRYVAEAVKAGVIISDRSAAREEFVTWIRNELGSSYVDDGLALLDNVLEQEAKPFLAQRFRERQAAKRAAAEAETVQG